MKKGIPILVLVLTVLISTFGWASARLALHAAPQQPIPAPVLKWQHGGCYSSWCENGWYSSPAVVDLEGDGTMEVVASPYTIFVLDGPTGAVEWYMRSGHDRSEPDADSVGRTWPGIVVADVDGDGLVEIATAHGGGYVSLYDHQGYFQPGWPQRPTERELRGLSVYDLDGDGTMEVIVTAAIDSAINTWVYGYDGVLRPGWPQLSNTGGYAWGLFNDNAAIGDVDGDSVGELVIPSDVHYICAYELDGTHIPAHSMYGDKNWGQVGIWESLSIELRGWGRCDGVREESYRTNFANGPAVIGDVDRDGVVEVVATGNVYDCNAGYPPSRYMGVYVFNIDRSRFNTGGYDWQSVPVDTGAPLVENYSVIESVMPNPAVADLDGDGHQEILYASYDGRVHAFWLDKTEHGSWPYSVYPGGAYRFASEPVVADLNNDGLAEVLFGSWVQKGTNLTGKLHILDYLGNPVHEVDLPLAYSGNWNGALPAPTLDDIDGDPDLEIVLNTAHSGVVAYDLPGTANARVLWGTGRGNYQRTGSLPAGVGTLDASVKQAHPILAGPGATIAYTITLQNPGPALSGVQLTDTLPAELHYLGNLWASAGSYGEAGGTITWTGSVLPVEPVTITFGASVDGAIPTPSILVNSAWIDDGWGNLLERQAMVVVDGYVIFLPLVPQ